MPHAVTAAPDPATGFQNNPVSWYWNMLADFGMILSMAMVTLPLYSLVSNTVQRNEAGVRAAERAERRAARAAAAKARGG